MDWKNIYLKESKPFTSKREINWFGIKVILGSLIVTTVITILLWPPSVPEQKIFHEKTNGNSLTDIPSEQSDPTQETVNQIQAARENSQQVHSSLEYLYRPDNRVSGGDPTNQPNRNSGMILARSGFDSRTQLSPGTKIKLRITQDVSISEESVPVIGTVLKDVNAELGNAIPAGSKVLGDVSFETSSEKVCLTLRAIILPDGRERPFSATAFNSDSNSGLRTRIRSESAKNAIGQTMTKFVGAYASGSMNTGAFGANPGGGRNGLRNAIAETATERANIMSEEMQKERKWAEISSNQEITAVITQPFSFRDPGGTYGR